jgi:hypothetical protein
MLMIRECVETGISNAVVDKSKAQLKPLPHLKSSCGLVDANVCLRRVYS